MYKIDLVISEPAILHLVHCIYAHEDSHWEILTAFQNKGTLCANYEVFTLAMPNPCTEKSVQSPENSRNELLSHEEKKKTTEDLFCFAFFGALGNEASFVFKPVATNM